MTWNGISTFAVGQKLSASVMNQVGGDLNAIGNAWTSYTPAWTTSGTQPTVGNGTVLGQYVLAGKLLIIRVNVVIGSTTSVGTGGPWGFSLPSVTSHNVGNQTLGCRSVQTSNFLGYALLTANSATIQAFLPTSTANNAMVGVTNTSPAAWATNNELEIWGAVQVA